MVLEAVWSIELGCTAAMRLSECGPELERRMQVYSICSGGEGPSVRYEVQQVKVSKQYGGQ